MLKDKLIEFVRDEEGATAIEYALMAAMVALVVIGFMDDIKTAVSTIFGDIKTGLAP